MQDPTHPPVRDVAHRCTPVPPPAEVDGEPPVRASARCFLTAERCRSRIFLTGATGFLGSRLLPELLRRTNAAVVCLVRAADPGAGLRRVQAAAAEHGMPLTADELRRISVRCGDVSLPHLGMSDGEWMRMADAVDTVYHCAAWVNAVHPYGVLAAEQCSGNERGSAVCALWAGQASALCVDPFHIRRHRP